MGARYLTKTGIWEVAERSLSFTLPANIFLIKNKKQQRLKGHTRWLLWGVYVCCLCVCVCVLNRISSLENGQMDGPTYSNSGFTLDWIGAYPSIHWTDDRNPLCACQHYRRPLHVKLLKNWFFFFFLYQHTTLSQKERRSGLTASSTIHNSLDHLICLAWQMCSALQLHNVTRGLVMQKPISCTACICSTMLDKSGTFSQYKPLKYLMWLVIKIQRQRVLMLGVLICPFRNFREWVFDQENTCHPRGIEVLT